jgi:hypothetical protein
MRLHALTLVLVLIALPAMAQPNLDEDRPSPPLSLEAGIALTADWASLPYLVSLRCEIGDPERWRQIFSAMDRRIDYCANRHFEWQAIRQEALSHARRDGVLDPSDDRLAEGRFRKRVAETGLEWDKKDRSTMCAWYRSSAVWRDVLAPGSVPEQEAAAAWREEAGRERDNPHYCPHGLCAESFRTLRQWGEQQSWVMAPCATVFPDK